MGIFARPFAGDCPALTKRNAHRPVRKHIAAVSIYKAQNIQLKKKGVGGRESKQARLNFINVDDVSVTKMQGCCSACLAI